MEEELDIMRIEREAEYDKQKQEEEQKKFFESEFHMDMLLEQDRKFATHLVTEIWRGMCLDDLTWLLDSVKPDHQGNMYGVASSDESTIIFEVFIFILSYNN